MARPKKPESEKLTKTIAWRVSEQIKNDLTSQYHESGLTQSEFLRELLERKRLKIISNTKPSVDKKRLIYLYNKTSNNLNQIAKNLNINQKNGLVENDSYKNLLIRLGEISNLLKKGIDNVD